MAPLSVIAREWLRIGLIGFGGPPAHITLLRDLVVRREGWMDARAFEDANAACSLLPGPSSTQLSIFWAYGVGGPWGAVIGGLGFVVPAVLLVLVLSILFLSSSPPLWVRGAGAGAGAAVAAGFRKLFGKKRKDLDLGSPASATPPEAVTEARPEPADPA